MVARIYQPAKTAMQSGQARTHTWVLEFEPEDPRLVDPLMGWTSTTDMRGEVRMEFESREAAMAYAERNGIAYTVAEATPRRHLKKSYAENFKFGRIGTWTH